MAVHKFRKGLDLPINGRPQQTIDDAQAPSQVAIVAADYPGMKPRMEVKVGDDVQRGQRLFDDRKTPGVRFTAPAAGKVAAIHRGERRALVSVVIDVSTKDGPQQQVAFKAYKKTDAGQLKRDDIVALLVESGLWTALRKRPFGRVPAPDSTADALFVTAIDTHPLAPSVDVVVQARRADFERGMAIVANLCDGPTYLCRARGSSVAPGTAAKGVHVEEFEGPHPAGTPGLHIHRLFPVNRNRSVWHLGYQDVIAIGHLFGTGELDVERVVSLAGPSVKRPRLLKTRLGASLTDLTKDEVSGGDNRIISGSVVAGRTAQGEAAGFLGRYNNQVSVLPEGHHREFLGWLSPGLNKFSVIPIFISKLFGRERNMDMTTTTHGSPRAMVPIGLYEKVMPFDILPTFLLRALHSGDVERAERLGALELDEEDLALCTFVCPGKTDWGALLRQNLDEIEREG